MSRYNSNYNTPINTSINKDGFKNYGSNIINSNNYGISSNNHYSLNSNKDKNHSKSGGINWEDNVNLAYNQIKKRHEKLLHEKELITGMRVSFPENPLNKRKNDISSLYTYQNLNQNRQTLADRNYNYNMMEPIYYPLENPVKGEPIKMPKWDMGQVATNCGRIHNECKKKKGFMDSKEEQLLLLAYLLKSGDFDLNFDSLATGGTLPQKRKDIRDVDQYDPYKNIKMTDDEKEEIYSKLDS